jgi:lipopolysaccharide/colanic/teichoic acid biosynthesis glycosyltransferase
MQSVFLFFEGVTVLKGTQDYISYEKADEKVRQSMDRLFAAPKKNFWRRKRIFDVTASFLAVLVLLPFLAVIYVVIFIDDPHASPIFCQKRIGRHGKEFTMYKFRTMVANAEQMKNGLFDQNEMDGPVFKIKDDPRITRIGKFLRSTSIDELLQLFNVLKGDMSLVGPRPPLPEEVALYNDYQRLRLVVTPGLTCFWQTANDRNDISFDEWVEMDIKYIETRTFWTDIKIIVRTVLVVITREGR